MRIKRRPAQPLLKPHSTPSRSPIDKQVVDCLYCSYAGINLHL